MKRYWKIGVAVALLISMVVVATSKETSPTYTEMQVKGVTLETIGHNPVVLLADKEEKKVLPIWIGLLEANAIDKELKSTASPRPMTHDLLQSILAHVQVKVKEIRIIDLKDSTYYATLFLKTNKEVIEVDARPSDAIILALKSKTPILVATKILDEQGIALTQKSAHSERFGIRIQELTPALASHFNFKGGKGVLVSEVVPSSVSETAGIQAGDIIINLNSKEVGSVQQFESIFDTLGSENPVRIFLFRDNKSREVDLPAKR
jgi:bifunctional DNase/RNase